MPVVATPGWAVPSHITANRMFGTQAFSDIMASQGILSPVLQGGGMAPPTTPPAPTPTAPPAPAPAPAPAPSFADVPGRPQAPADQMAPIKQDPAIQAAGTAEATSMMDGLTREKTIAAGEIASDSVYRATLGYKRKRLLGE